MKRDKVWHEAFAWLQIVLGLLFSASAYRMYLIPNEIAPGGFTGIGQLVHSLTGWPIGLISLCLNVPLFAVCMRRMGLLFGVKSLITTMLFSMALDHLNFMNSVTNDPMLAAVFGGVLAGIGFGLILRGGASTGGTDMLGLLVNDHFPVVKVSVVAFAVDVLVIIASAFVFDATSAMFALISTFLFSKVLDLVLEGLNTSKAYYIISDQSEAIADRILNEMNRGATALRGVGMHSGEDKLVLLCVINRMETVRLRNIIAAIDPRAFVIATDVTEALGEGFKPHVKM